MIRSDEIPSATLTARGQSNNEKAPRCAWENLESHGVKVPRPQQFPRNRTPRGAAPDNANRLGGGMLFHDPDANAADSFNAFPVAMMARPIEGQLHEDE